MPARHAQLAWIDGRFVDWDDASVHLMTHALHHASAVFEGVRCYDGERGPAVFRLDDHLARLERSARAVHLELRYSRAELRSAALGVLRAGALADCYLRPIVFRGYGVLGLNPEGSPTSVGFAAWDAVPLFGAAGGRAPDAPVRLTVSQWRRPAARHAPMQVKASGLYMTIGMAKAEAQRAGFDDALMLSDDGFVAEATVENVFLVTGGRLVTPPSSAGILCGITRATVMTLAREIGLTVDEHPVVVDDVLAADEVFLTGTAAEVTAVGELHGHRFDARRPVTRLLQEAYARAVRGGAPGHDDWLTAVS